MIEAMTNTSQSQAQGHGTRQRSRGRRVHTVTRQLRGHGLTIKRQQRSLQHIATCFTDQAAMLAVQCEEAQLRLRELRCAVRQTLQFLHQLDPATTERIRPYGTIAKLTSLHFWLSQAILTLAMFAPIAELVCYERIEFHLFLQSLFPRLLATYEDVLSQLAALSERQKQEASRQEEVTR